MVDIRDRPSQLPKNLNLQTKLMLLEKLRQKCPSYSIRSEFNQIYNGQFISSVEIFRQDSIFKSFAQGITIEDAEDKALQRALNLFFAGNQDDEQFGFSVVIGTNEISSTESLPDKESSIDRAIKKVDQVVNMVDLLLEGSSECSPDDNAIAEQSPPVEPEKPAKKRKTKPVEEVLPVEQPEPVATQPVEESASNCDDGFCEINQVSFPPVDEPVIEAPKPIEPEPEAPILTLETQVVEAPKLELTEPLDFGAVMATMNEHLKRLGWTNEQGKAYLLETYGKRSRQLLSDEELLEFLAYLESQPDPANV